MLSTNKVVNNTLESDYKNNIQAMDNEVAHDSLESDDDTPPNSHGISNKKRGQIQDNKIIRYMMPRCQNDSQHGGGKLDNKVPRTTKGGRHS
jgi:hypothetical protein